MLGLNMISRIFEFNYCFPFTNMFSTELKNIYWKKLERKSVSAAKCVVFIA